MDIRATLDAARSDHDELQARLSEVLAWIRQREMRGDRVSDELLHLVHSIEHRAALASLRREWDTPLVSDPAAFAFS